MISLISGNEPQKDYTMEQVAVKHNVTEHTQMPVKKTQPLETKDDNVTLSHRARAQQLKNKGCSVQEIAIIMNSDAKTINSYIL